MKINPHNSPLRLLQKLLSATIFAISAAVILSSCNTVTGPTTDEWETSQTILQSKSSKRGVCYSFQLPQQDTELLGSAISWAYNWGASLSDDRVNYFNEYGIDYCPMAWNGSSGSLTTIREYVNSHPECEYILGYNEPNLTDQANMTPTQAASYWPDLAALAEELGVKLISPAMNYGTLSGYSDPITWLDEFFDLIGGTDGIDGIAVHWYSEDAGTSLISYVDMFKKYGKPIWVTEFCGTNKTESSQITYMTTTLNYLEADPDVFRYAWFIPRGSSDWTVNQLLEGTSSLTDLGVVYVNLSTLDTDTYYPTGSMVPAEHYSNSSGVEDYNSPIYVQVSEEDGGLLDVYNFNSGKWLEYGLETEGKGVYTFQLRYRSSIIDSSVEFFIDGESQGEVVVPATSGEWADFEVDLTLKKGQQTLRIQVNDGILTKFNYFRFAVAN